MKQDFIPRKPGRFCPLDYYFDEDEFTKKPMFSCETLYIAGGMYGNPFAFEALWTLAAKEPGARVVLNGDMHWFDRSPADFVENERRAEKWLCLLGNVEAELRRGKESGAGCGCAYPPCVDDAAVARSNAIHAELKKTLTQIPAVAEKLKKRAGAAVVDVCGARVGITHGDERSLGGWNCSLENLRIQARRAELTAWMEKSGLAVLATTHTCAAAAFARLERAVINNGAAGMPNFRGALYGLITRISPRPEAHAIYRARVRGLYVEAVPLRWDADKFLNWFNGNWPAGSPAEISYHERITQGAGAEPQDALIEGFEPLG
ncbi:MAG TPA: hypothetical protein IAC22_00670 [Candidatus Caccocola faecipullorum]|nr:hypothetical protein [Candidatus Caccocola faecipullorum]